MNPVQEGGNQFAALFEAMPAKRIGRAEDVVGAVVYLCSEAGVSILNRARIELTVRLQSYVDGHCLCMDGGRVLFANGQ